MDVLDGLGLLEAEVLHHVGLERLGVDVLGEGGLAHRAKLPVQLGLAVAGGVLAGGGRRLPGGGVESCG